jgi:2-keto-3-deoxy-L-rhamnonate aldolase RhmA
MNKLAIKKGETTIGSWITLGHPAIAEILASSGFDWLAVDLEHSSITIREAEDLIRVIDLKGIAPLVRLSSNNSEQIKRVMDAGAHGVIVPMVKTVEDVRDAVSAVRYPPSGGRSIGLARAQGYGSQFAKYLEWESNNSLVIVQIEHVEAVNNLEEIFQVEGVSGYIVGPYDLSGSIGQPGKFSNPEFLELMERIKSVAADHDMPGGYHIVEPDIEELRRCVSEGHEFIAFSLDIRMLDVCAKRALKIAKENMP